MKHDDTDLLTADERFARDAVRGLGVPALDPQFRARLKHDFMAGTLVLAPRPGRVLAGPWARSWPIALLPVAAALLVLFAVMSRGPQWEVLDVTGQGLVVVDGRPIPVSHTEQLARALRPGVRIQVNGAELELAAPGTLVLQVTNGTDMTLPRTPGRWFARTTRGAVRNGEVRITTGPHFRGARLAVDTPEAAVEVVGTTLAVIREPAGTCVCVLDGTVTVGPKGGEMAPVTEGHRGFVFGDGRPMEFADIRPNEIGKLGMFRDQHGGRLGASTR